MTAAAAGLQLYYASELDDSCNNAFDDVDLTTAPNIAGLGLIISFLINGVWIWSKRDKLSLMNRIALLLWTVSVMIGTAAAGAALGQAELIVADDKCDVDSYVFLHYVSIILLILSISLPHAMKKNKHKDSAVDGTDDGKPLTKMERLRFL